MSKAQEVQELSEQARIAFRAYQDMNQSKTIYFQLLQDLDSKYKSGGAPSISENLQLEKLLKEHDNNVAAFSIAMSAVEDTNDRTQLIKLMS